MVFGGRGVIRVCRPIRRAAEERFGAGARPAAILLTHGHFDHVGALETLAHEWGTPVYAHPLELPYITGRQSYPPPDPEVGGGMMSWLSPLYARGPVDVGRRAVALPRHGAVPGLPEWRWIATPGHAPGHVSFFREDDGVLLAGDAFITVKQESAMAVLLQRQRVHGPPAYYTINWDEARESVRRLAALDPQVAATGHGLPMSGAVMRKQLQHLAGAFDDLAAPAQGMYLRYPAMVRADGSVAAPRIPLTRTLLSGAAVLTVAGLVYAAMRERGGQ